jgi:hypothetical protein
MGPSTNIRSLVILPLFILLLFSAIHCVNKTSNNQNKAPQKVRVTPEDVVLPYLTAVWTGSEMIIWNSKSDGINLQIGTGKIYDPVSSSWRNVTSKNAPGKSYYHTSVWTGKEMIVRGGYMSVNVWVKTGACISGRQVTLHSILKKRSFSSPIPESSYLNIPHHNS